MQFSFTSVSNTSGSAGKTQTLCYHCSDPCPEKRTVFFDEKAFCCEGCRTVYELLNQNSLCEYYKLDSKPGLTPTTFPKDKWSFLDNKEVEKEILRFRSETIATAVLYIPLMHCTSCIYLLENLYRLEKGVISSQVNYLKKELTLKYNPQETTLRKVVETMCAIGYPPTINLGDVERKKKKSGNRSLIYKIGVAGFCFGNIMVLSLPEYFDWKALMTEDFSMLFRILNMLLVLPVLLYSGSDYFRAAFYGIRSRTVNMEIPIAIGITGLAIQSFHDVFTGSGGGYFDSMAGFIFMLLVGKFFQQRTYDALSFDRDYKAYFPLAVTKLNADDKEESIKVTSLKKDDIILIHNEELIPADCLLEEGRAHIDYSFVSGESEPVNCKQADLIYAGGRNKGPLLQLKVVNEVSQSYLTQLWNSEAFMKEKKMAWGDWSNRMARYFTLAVIVIALFTGIYWKFTDPEVMMRAVISVLIVACPCVLALTIPFTFGAILRILGRNGFYLKNGESIENLAEADTVIFDKTGTLTHAEKVKLEYEGENLSSQEKQMIASVAEQSTHPVSRSIKNALNEEINYQLDLENVSETPGHGIAAEINGHQIKIGRKAFAENVHNNNDSPMAEATADTYISLNSKIKGKFRVQHVFRDDLKKLSADLKNKFRIFILSGDSERDKQALSNYFPAQNLHFHQKPHDKLNFIAAEKANGHKVIMIGDGLNDAGALRESNFGITITDDINSFTPASDAIMDATKLGKLPQFVSMAKASKSIIFGSFIFSTSYNIIGLSFAVRGMLEPWVAACLMPLSSITVVLYSHITSYYAAKKRNL